MESKYLFDFMALSGAFLLLLGFYRTSIGKWKSKSFWYELDNAAGAILLGTYQFHKRAYITMILNAIWATVAIRGMTSYAERKRLRKKRS